MIWLRFVVVSYVVFNYRENSCKCNDTFVSCASLFSVFFFGLVIDYLNSQWHDNNGVSFLRQVLDTSSSTLLLFFPNSSSDWQFHLRRKEPCSSLLLVHHDCLPLLNCNCSSLLLNMCREMEDSQTLISQSKSKTLMTLKQIIITDISLLYRWLWSMNHM